jgi:hypothetical protein
MFGQVEKAETHLVNQGVEIGSLFLFWGWFAHEGAEGIFRDQPGFSAIFGYLEVAETIEVGCDKLSFDAAYHPHFSDGYPHRRNRIYVARKTLSFNPRKPGWGVFRYHDRLRLSAPGMSRANWRLPMCFHPDRNCALSHNLKPEHWSTNGRSALLRIPGRGQEFVCELTGRVAQWARQIINATEIWSPTP